LAKPDGAANSYNMMKNFFMLVGMSVFLATTVFGAIRQEVDRDGARCDRTLTYESLSDGEKAALNKGQLVSRFVKQPNGYEIGYVFKAAAFDPELVMGVYSSCGEHAGENGLGDFIVKSKVLGPNPEQPANPFRVFYEQHVSWPYDNGTYTVENSVSGGSEGYLFETNLIDSSDASFSPRWSDGYVRAVSQGNGVFVVACNYMVPRSNSFKGKFIDLARERLKASGDNLMKWVMRVSADNEKAHGYRERIKALLGG
jgi:hypothetical protein